MLEKKQRIFMKFQSRVDLSKIKISWRERAKFKFQTFETIATCVRKSFESKHEVNFVFIILIYVGDVNKSHFNFCVLTCVRQFSKTQFQLILCEVFFAFKFSWIVAFFCRTWRKFKLKIFLNNRRTQSNEIVVISY